MQRISLALAGDVGPCRADVSSMFRYVGATVRQSDVAFCQLEPVLTRRGEAMPQARLAMRSAPETAGAIRRAGFHVVSFASNHCLDYGQTGLLDTIEALSLADLKVVGVGPNLAIARRPVIVTAGGVRIAFLAYCTILPMNYWAEEKRAGCAPLRAWSLHEQIEHDQPGTPARTHSFAHREDLESMKADVAAARAQADHVVVSIHWGVHFVPGELAQYQREMAYAAIDAGASIIIGHHPHVLKAIEVYRGRAILYSLGNFALDAPTAFASDLRSSKGFKEIQKLAKNWDERNLLPPDTLHSLLVRCRLTKDAVETVELLPVRINADCEPTLPVLGTPEFDTIARYLDFTCTSQALPIPYKEVEGSLRIEF
ncbi:MAG TPA: CapA family protein [Steroidobacteraceae bacterium]|nr:CapA family protein [Steroidobacteraceae bacterium]